MYSKFYTVSKGATCPPPPFIVTKKRTRRRDGLLPFYKLIREKAAFRGSLRLCQLAILFRCENWGAV
jgi:hypothetical protein